MVCVVRGQANDAMVYLVSAHLCIMNAVLGWELSVFCASDSVCLLTLRALQMFVLLLLWVYIVAAIKAHVTSGSQQQTGAWTHVTKRSHPRP